jgi:hypothetical protein
MEMQTSVPFIPHPICFGDAAGTLTVIYYPVSLFARLSYPQAVIFDS